MAANRRPSASARTSTLLIGASQSALCRACHAVDFRWHRNFTYLRKLTAGNAACSCELTASDTLPAPTEAATPCARSKAGSRSVCSPLMGWLPALASAKGYAAHKACAWAISPRLHAQRKSRPLASGIQHLTELTDLMRASPFKVSTPALSAGIAMRAVLPGT